MIKTYDRLKAVEYAQKFALKPNPQYYFFGGIGGDCTNFISQCLLAGGGEMNFDYVDGWYYISQNDRSPSWTSVAYLNNFLLRVNLTKGPKGEIAELSKLEVGDIIQLRQNSTHFNHTVIISDIVNGKIFVCAHSDASLNKPLDQYFYFQTLGIHIEGVVQ